MVSSLSFALILYRPATQQLQKEHSKNEGENVYFLIKWNPPKGINLG